MKLLSIPKFLSWNVTFDIYGLFEFLKYRKYEKMVILNSACQGEVIFCSPKSGLRTEMTNGILYLSSWRKSPLFIAFMINFLQDFISETWAKRDHPSGKKKLLFSFFYILFLKLKNSNNPYRSIVVLRAISKLS